VRSTRWDCYGFVSCLFYRSCQTYGYASVIVSLVFMFLWFHLGSPSIYTALSTISFFVRFSASWYTFLLQVPPTGFTAEVLARPTAVWIAATSVYGVQQEGKCCNLTRLLSHVDSTDLTFPYTLLSLPHIFTTLYRTIHTFFTFSNMPSRSYASHCG